jgi:hypothetical protein
MYAAVNYEMTEADLEEILNACKSVPLIMVGGMGPSSPQENANRAWKKLGDKMGFDHMTVQPRQGFGNRFFTAVPNETAEAKAERESREAEEGKRANIKRIEGEIAVLQAKMTELLASTPSPKGAA